MIQIACQCEQGYGCPHSHVTAAEVRRLDDDKIVRINHDWIPQPGYELVSEVKSIRYWGTDINVSTRDLEVLLTCFYQIGDVDLPEASRLHAAVTDRRATFPVPAPERFRP